MLKYRSPKSHSKRTTKTSPQLKQRTKKNKKVKKMSQQSFSTQLTEKDINPLVLKAEYAVRGELVIKADQYNKDLAAGDKNLPFDKIISCNIGNPQQLGQKPLTFFRQVIALAHYPEMMNDPVISAAFPADAIARAKKYLSNTPSTGAYTHSKGLPIVRQEVADFIKRRDGYEVDPESLWITDGASSGVKMFLQSIITNENDGVLTPIPQYPLYSATMQLLNAKLVGYYLDEANGWSLSVDELEKQYQAATAEGTTVKAITIINPGNPTGQCLTYDAIKGVVDWAEKRGLMILADEVYQDNAYSTTPFTSFFKVVKDTGSKVPLVSFHSASKGYYSECGIRSGYLQLENFPQVFYEQLYKMSSISLCSNVTGQIMMGLISNTPQPGEPSYELFVKERDGILESLKRRALKMSEALNAMEGVSSQTIEGALYAFPQITLPKKAIEAAKEAGKAPDTFYALQLLDNTGICVVPGSGFKQVPGTWHYRTTILPPEKDIDTVIAKTAKFHEEFMNKYRD